MKYQLPTNYKLLVFAFLLVLVACQEIPNSGEIEPIDEDMIAAQQLAHDYLNASRGNINVDLSVTVLKFEDGQLLFGTDSDAINGYEVITEETVTAEVVPGEYVFWYCGSGLSDLGGIVFDEESMLQLVDNPDPLFGGKLWKLTIPKDVELDEDGYFKYDIVYQYEGNDGPPIVLDPKLKTPPSDNDEE